MFFCQPYQPQNQHLFNLHFHQPPHQLHLWQPRKCYLYWCNIQNKLHLQLRIKLLRYHHLQLYHQHQCLSFHQCLYQLKNQHFCQHVNLHCNNYSRWLHLWHLYWHHYHSQNQFHIQPSINFLHHLQFELQHNQRFIPHCQCFYQY